MSEMLDRIVYQPITYLILRLFEHQLDHHGFEDVVDLVLQPEEVLLFLLLASLGSTLVSFHSYVLVCFKYSE